MKKQDLLRLVIIPFVILSVVSFSYQYNWACTSLLVTKGASADGSTMITYTCDAEFLPHLSYSPAADYPPGDSVAIDDWRGNQYGYIDQVEHTYAVVELMNEHQLAISETTFDGREELRNPDGMLHYWDLMFLALQRAKTAREAIEVMTSLVDKYGYRATGESISIADPDEVWLLEIIGPGPGGKGAQWVARKIPDGYICAHANKSRIGEFPLNDKENCLYSENVIDFAIEKGYYDPDSGEPFLFNETYCPSTPKNLRWAEGRVWSLFRRTAPSLNLDDGYFRAEIGAERYPLWIKPDEKISVQGVFDLMRDHFEGTPYDMTEGIDAGAFGSPYRWRPLHFSLDSSDSTADQYGWERPISTQQTAYSFVSQSRASLPDPIGGVLWYGVDDTYSTCYFPLYCGIGDIPKPYTVGSLQEFSFESAWWVFNLAANYANLKYSYMIKDIQAVQTELESQFLTMQSSVEQTAMNLLKDDSLAMAEYLTDYSLQCGNKTFEEWQNLAGHLITKYNDGYVKDENGRAQGVGYPVEWLKKVVAEDPNKLLPRSVDSLGIRLVD